MHQFGVRNRRKAVKKTSSGLTGKFTIKKFEFYLRPVFLEKFLLCLRIVTFHIEVPLMTNLIYSQMMPMNGK